jgi:O-antigen ligase
MIRNRPGFTRLPQFWALIAFVISISASAIVAERWLAAPIPVITKFSVSMTVFFLVLWNADSFKRLKWIAVTVVISSVLLSAQGLYSYFTGWDTWRVMNVYVDDTVEGQHKVQHDDEYEAIETDLLQKGDFQGVNDLWELAKSAAIAKGTISVRIRGNGVMQDPNDLSMGLLTSLPLCWLAVKKGRKLRNLFCIWIPTGLIVVTMFYSRSRGGLLALLVILAIMYARRMGKTKSLALVAVVALVILGAGFTGGRSMSGDDESSEGRLNAWREGFMMFRSNPILGVGMNNFIEYNQLTAHNSFVLCFSETGLSGYFWWITILVGTVLQISALMKVPGDTEVAQHVRRWAGALQLSMWGFVVSGFFLSRSYVYVLYLFTAMVGGLALIARREGLDASFPKVGQLFKTAALVEVASMVSIYVLVRVGSLMHMG